jgi:RNAse (barnase) inhibitor barstar
MTPVSGRHRLRLSVSAVEAAARLDAAGWRAAVLDGRRCGDKARLLAELQRALALPDWFGANWDAVVDVLRERADGGLALVLDRAELTGRPGAVLGEIVDDVAAEGYAVALYRRERPWPWRGAPARSDEPE